MNHIIGLLGKAGSGKDTVADYLVQHHGFVKMSLADEMKRFCKKVFGFTDEQLWGPSANRNAADARFDDIEAWEKAEGLLFDHGFEWCEFLFSEFHGDLDERWFALLEWFDDLRLKYSPEWDGGATEKLSPRIVLQTIGTEFGRAQDEKVWVRATLKVAQKALNVPMWYTYTRESGLVKRATADERPLEEALPTYPAGVVIPDCRFTNEVESVKAAGGRVIRIKRPGTVLAQVGVASHASEVEQDSIPDTAFDHVLESPEGLTNLGITLHAFIPTILRSMS